MKVVTAVQHNRTTVALAESPGISESQLPNPQYEEFGWNDL